MTDRKNLAEAVKRRLVSTGYYNRLNDEQYERIISRMLACEEFLLPNLTEWVNKNKISDIWVNDKYCVGAVMKIRKNDDFVAAFIALDDYAKDPNTEIAIWQRWS